MLKRKGQTRHRGSVLIWVTIAMVMMMMFISLAVDVGRAHVAKTELARAGDAATRYGAAGLSQGVTAVQNRVIASAADNTADGAPLAIDPNNDIGFGTSDPTTRALRLLAGLDRRSPHPIRAPAAAP